MHSTLQRSAAQPIIMMY